MVGDGRVLPHRAAENSGRMGLEKVHSQTFGRQSLSEDNGGGVGWGTVHFLRGREMAGPSVRKDYAVGLAHVPLPQHADLRT